MKNKQEKFLEKISRLICKEMHRKLVCVSLYMNIDIKTLLIDCEKDYDKFWSLITKYYDDYMKGSE